MANYSEYGRMLATPLPGEEIVISGLSGRFPKSNDVYEFAENLFKKSDMLTETSPAWQNAYPEIPKRTGKIYNTHKFDAGFFGVHHRQADVMVPSMRKVLETAIEAIMDAGVNPSELKGSRTGMFLAHCNNEVEIKTLMDATETQISIPSVYYRSLIAHRVSYYLKLKGPSCVVDTACSSSIHALELAYRSMRSGKCDNALVAGAHILEYPAATLQFYRLGVLSDDATCRVFDQDASGYARSEAIVCIFLQKSKNTKRNYGEIVYSKINCDGFKKEGMTFPSSKSQQHLLTQVLYDSQVEPNEICFLAAHAAGTTVGDPQEVETIDNVIAKKRTKPLLVGAVKSSMGHCEPASGLCSLAKLIIVMERGCIVPNIHFNKIKKGLVGLEQGRMKVVTEVTKLESEDTIFALNNFGLGGANAHVLLRRFGKIKILEISNHDTPRLVCVSGRTKEAVSVLINDLNKKSVDNEFIGLIQHLFQSNFDQHNYRGFTILTNNGSIITSTKLYNQKQIDLYVFFGNIEKCYHFIAQHLFIFSQFRETLEKIQVYSMKQSVDIIQAVSGKIENRESSAFIAFATYFGTIKLLKLLELKPKIIYDNPVGELVDVLCSGKLTLEDAVLKVSAISKEKWQKKRLSCNYDDLNSFSNIPKNAKILVVSNQPAITNSNHIHLRDNFLECLGMLYEEGLNPQIHKLYTQIQFPVSRNTPMISPSIKWNYDKNWYTYNFDNEETNNRVLRHKFTLSYNLHTAYEYLKGHVVDERNLIPSTAYLFFVWQTLAKNDFTLLKNLPVVFTNCKFVRAVVMPEADAIQLLVSINSGSGNFEIIERESVVVKGNIKKIENNSENFIDFSAPTEFDEDSKIILEHDEIYREFGLRGYNYSGLFKGIKRCNADGSAGLIQWEDNWVTFMDKMLQISILHKDTKQLYLPISIKKLIIVPRIHLSFIKSQKDMLCPVYRIKNCNSIKCGGIEMKGLHDKSTSRRILASRPVLEKYVFVPNILQTNLSQSIRINTQIIHENTLDSDFKAVELLDEFTQPNRSLILPLLKSAADDIPLLETDLTISTESALSEISDIAIKNYTFTPKSNLILIVGTKLLQRGTVLKEILNSLRPNGFIMTREEQNFVFGSSQYLEIFTEHVTENEKLILLRKSDETSDGKMMEVTSDNANWLPELQEVLKREQNIVLYNRSKSDGTLGFINCLRREPGKSKIKGFLMLDDAPDFDLKKPFYRMQYKKQMAVNIYKNNTWGTYRHLLLDGIPKVASAHCYASVTVKGDVSSLKWLEGPLNEKSDLERDKILVYPFYAAINFKDVMLATGRITADDVTTTKTKQECLYGFEFCGRNTSGKRFMGITGNGAIATMISVDKKLLWEVPNHWSSEDASTVPVVYATVIYALLRVVQIKPGMSILIHSAAGGIGLAALNVCLHHGCEIFITAGTQRKRDYLMEHFSQIPESHIGNSRDTSFEELIKTETKSRGVDVVLNSLAEEKLVASIRCLAKGGHFLEIGRYDLEMDTFLNMLIMEKGVTYHGIMLDRIMSQSPDIKDWIFNKVLAGINEGYVKPLPRKVFNHSEVEQAFRYMMTGNHIGKVLVKVQNENRNNELPKGIPRIYCNPEEAYIILGGLGGFGLELADWLVLRGAKKLILVSRSGIQSGYQARKIKNWKSYSVTVKVSELDVTTEQGCADLIKEAFELGIVGGIFNVAVVLKDANFEDQTEETFRISLGPKAKATTYLDQLSRTHCSYLRYFVVFSSISCGRGNGGQTNYGMVNSVMERICEKRKSEGFPAVAIQWAAVGDVGIVAKMQIGNKKLVIRGTIQQKIASCLEVLDILLNQDNPVVASMIVAKTSKCGSDNVVEIVASLLGIKDIKTVNQQATLIELGLDSISATEMAQIFEKNFDIYLTPKELRSLTFAKLTDIEKGEFSAKDESSKFQTGRQLLIQHVPNNESNHSHLLKLSDNIDEKDNTIFLLPGADGIFEPFKFLVKNLKANLFGLQYSFHSAEDSVQEIAATLLPHTENKFSKNKPFIIIAYSFGSLVGLELAGLLEQRGYGGTIILIDGSHSYLKSAIIETVPFKTDIELQCFTVYQIMLILLPTDVVEKEKEKLFKCNTIDEMDDLLFSLVPDDIIRRKKLGRQAAFVLYKRIKFIVDYKFDRTKIKSKVYLIKPTQPLTTVSANDYNLSELCEKPVEVFTLDGDHVSILYQTGMVNIINNCI